MNSHPNAHANKGVPNRVICRTPNAATSGYPCHKIGVVPTSAQRGLVCASTQMWGRITEHRSAVSVRCRRPASVCARKQSAGDQMHGGVEQAVRASAEIPRQITVTSASGSTTAMKSSVWKDLTPLS
jgi:hypothetical protein